jgi:hypothetical protein
MRRGPIRLRVILPIVFGFLAAVLMVWDYENNRMVALMGMGWDMGPPFWPYEAVRISLSTVNAPAFVLSMPILKVLNLQTVSLQYGVWFPVIVCWWWWVGTRIDFGFLGRRHYRNAKLSASLLSIASLGLMYVAAQSGLDEIHWWLEYGHDSSPYRLPSLLRTVGSVFWCHLLAGGCSIAAIQLFQGRVAQPTGTRHRYRELLIGASLVAAYVFVLYRWDKALNPPFDYNVCAVDRLYGLGCFHGTIIGGSGEPLDGVYVELTPANKSPDVKQTQMRFVATDKLGRYNFNSIDPGEYVVSVHEYLAPNPDSPFAAAYYPGVEAESAAERVAIRASSRNNLDPFRLRKLEFETMKTGVRWSSGSLPERSDVCLENVQNTNQAMICSEIDNGEGELTLPKGFGYVAVAWVQCDVNKNIESRKSIPDQRINVGDGFTPAEIAFVIPGPPCELWKSK